jgi:hypothetical protein
LFARNGARGQIHSFVFDLQQYHRMDAGKSSLATGRARVTSQITLDSADLSFGVLHTGDHNIYCGVRLFRGSQPFSLLVRSLSEAFERAEFTQVIRVMDREFGESTYSLRSLFRDEQRRVTGLILQSTLADIEAAYRQVYANHAPLMRFLVDLQMPLPRELRVAAELVVNRDLVRALEREPLSLERVKALLEETAKLGLAIDSSALQIGLQGVIERRFLRLKERPHDRALIRQMLALVRLLKSMPVGINLWTAQNIYYQTLHSVSPERAPSRAPRAPRGRGWFEDFQDLGRELSIRV